MNQPPASSQTVPSPHWVCAWLVALLCTLALASLGASAHAQGRSAGPPAVAVPSLNTAEQSIGLDRNRDLWLDRSAKADAPAAKAMARGGGFKRFSELTPMRLQDGVLWMRVEVQRATDKPFTEQAWYLQVVQSTIDRVEMHWEDSQGQWQRLVAGDHIAVAQWPLPDRVPLFALPNDWLTEADGVSEVWLRITHSRVPFAAPISLVTERELLAQRERELAMMGVFLGIGFAAAVLCAYQIAVYRDSVFLAFAVVVVGYPLMAMQLSGTTGLLLWDESPAWHDRFTFALSEFLALATMVFVATACGVRWSSGRLAGVLKVWAAVSLGVLVMHQVLANQAIYWVSQIAIGSNLALILVVTALAHSRGDRYGRRLMLAMLPSLVAAAAMLARNFGLTASSWPLQFGLVFGGCLTAALLMAVLTQRSQDMRETLVRERALTSTDALTGLPHESVFFQRLHDALVRARRYNTQMGLVVLSLDNLDAYAAEAGFNGPERAVLLAASRMREVAREIDTPARVSVQELVLLVEGPMDKLRLQDVATRVLARMLRPTAELPGHVPFKSHLTAALFPAVRGARIGTENSKTLSATQIVRWLLAESRQYSPEVDKPVRVIDASALSGFGGRS
jgi:two-component system, sensor histidine kinase LadS